MERRAGTRNLPAVSSQEVVAACRASMSRGYLSFVVSREPLRDQDRRTGDYDRHDEFGCEAPQEWPYECCGHWPSFLSWRSTSERLPWDRSRVLYMLTMTCALDKGLCPTCSQAILPGVIIEFAASLDRPAVLDLLGGLRGGRIEDDGSMSDTELLEEVATALRDLVGIRSGVGAKAGTLTQVLRQRLATVATTIGVAEPGASLDFKTDRELGWGIADWILREGQAVAESQERSVTDAIGRRFLGYHLADRRRQAEDILRIGELLTGKRLTYKERQLEVANVLAGEPPIRDLDPEDLTHEHQVGLWIGSSIDDVREFLSGISPDSPDPALELVTIATPPAADLLSAWLLFVATDEETEEGARIKASSSRTRAQWSRYARAVTAVSLAVYTYGGAQPAPLVND
jgi:hypothetical protein